MKRLKNMLPGLLLCGGLTLLVFLLSHKISLLGGVAGALFSGLIIGNLFRVGGRFSSGIRFCEKTVLSTAIALMGVELQLAVLHRMGAWVLPLALATVSLSVGSGYAWGRLLGFSRKLSLLLATGNSVCGSSAIAAMAPSINAEEEDVGLSIGAVNLLGTLGIVFIPFLAVSLGLNTLQSAILTGGSLQAVGQVAAAGFAMSATIGKWALVVKMSRVLMIVPLVLVVPRLLHTQEPLGAQAGRKAFPLYIAGFVFFSILGTLAGPASALTVGLKTAGQGLMMVAMLAIGLNIRMDRILKAAPRALVTVALSTMVQIGFLLLVIHSGLIA